MKYDLNSKDFETEYKIKDIVTINNVDYKIKKSSSFDDCSKCSFTPSDLICMRIGSCLATKNGKDIPIHFKQIGGKK